ncbi:MAG: CD225/dispanin family protein [Phycisphaerales bacterium]|nr:CD225/dispanin family protein [Phycisphaerales bacterium]
MYCKDCGQQLNENQQHCDACGSAAQAPQMSAQPAAYASGSPSPTYLVPAILVTIFCCQIFGIVAIVYSAIAMGKNSSHDYMGAMESAKKAKMWCWLGFGVGFVVLAIYMALMFVGALAGAAATP